MSVTQTYTIQCPKCGERQEVELFESINVAETPELRDRLMANELNAVTCSACGFGFRVDKKLLYNDPERRLMVYWFPGHEKDYRENQQQFTDMLRALNESLPDEFEAPVVHLVFQRAELVERIFMLEAGLNERVIEYIKYMMYSKNMDRLNPAEKGLLFNAQDSNDDSLFFVIQDIGSHKLEGMMQYDRSAYDALCEMFDKDEQTASLLALFPGPYISARDLLIRDQDVG